MANDLGVSVRELIGNKHTIERLDIKNYISKDVGLPTLKDIKFALLHPGRDPRGERVLFQPTPGIEKMEDLKPGMELQGLVTNVTAFGTFVDIGVHRDGLIHISRLKGKDLEPAPGDVIRVKVLNVDLERNRISLDILSKEEQG